MWELLGIEETDDEDLIRSAYADAAKNCHPEEHPEEFKELHKQYKNAMKYAKQCKKKATVKVEQVPLSEEEFWKTAIEVVEKQGDKEQGKQDKTENSEQTQEKPVEQKEEQEKPQPEQERARAESESQQENAKEEQERARAESESQQENAKEEQERARAESESQQENAEEDYEEQGENASENLRDKSEEEYDYSEIFQQLQQKEEGEKDRDYAIKLYQFLEQVISRKDQISLNNLVNLLCDPHCRSLINKVEYFLPVLKYIEKSGMKEILEKTILPFIDNVELQQMMTKEESNRDQNVWNLLFELGKTIDEMARKEGSVESEKWKELFSSEKYRSFLNEEAYLKKFLSYLKSKRELDLDNKRNIYREILTIVDGDELKRLITQELERSEDYWKKDTIIKLYHQTERIVTEDGANFTDVWKRLFSSTTILMVLSDLDFLHQYCNYILNRPYALSIKQTITLALRQMNFSSEGQNLLLSLQAKLDDQQHWEREKLIQEFLDYANNIYQDVQTRNTILSWNYLFTRERYAEILHYADVLVRFTELAKSFQNINREIWEYFIDVTNLSKQDPNYDQITKVLKEKHQNASIFKYERPNKNLSIGDVEKVLYGGTGASYLSQAHFQNHTAENRKRTHKGTRPVLSWFSVLVALSVLFGSAKWFGRTSGSSYPQSPIPIQTFEPVTNPSQVESLFQQWRQNESSESSESLEDTENTQEMIGEENASIDQSEYKNSYRATLSALANIDVNGDGKTDKISIADHMITLTLTGTSSSKSLAKRTFDAHASLIVCGKKGVKTVVVRSSQSQNTTKYTRYWKYYALSGTGYELQQTMEESYDDSTGEYVTVVAQTDTGEKQEYRDADSTRSSSPRHDKKSVWYDDNKDGFTLFYE